MFRFKTMTKETNMAFLLAALLMVSACTGKKEDLGKLKDGVFPPDSEGNSTTSPSPTPEASPTPIASQPLPTTGATLSIEASNSEKSALGWTSAGGTPSQLKFAVQAPPTAKGRCRLTKKTEAAGDFKDCGNLADGQLTIALTELVSATNDGSYSLAVKISADGKDSTEVLKELYLHQSLNAVPTCNPDLNLSLFFAQAKILLPVNNVFGAQTKLEVPDYKIEFADGSISEFNSLRRKVALDEQKKVGLIYRAFESKANMGCENRVLTGEKNSNQAKPLERIDCQVLAFNAEGKGACLKINNGAVEFVRNIKSIKSKFAPGGRLSMFSPKTKVESGENDYTLFLPD